jgi:hypothetical protein
MYLCVCVCVCGAGGRVLKTRTKEILLTVRTAMMVTKPSHGGRNWCLINQHERKTEREEMKL